jgi:hypothetical protein
MTDISVHSTAFQVENRSWLLSPHGTDPGTTPSITLDISAFTAGTHYPDGYIMSGEPLAELGSGLYAPYAAAGATGGDVAEISTITAPPPAARSWSSPTARPPTASTSARDSGGHPGRDPRCQPRTTSSDGGRRCWRPVHGDVDRRRRLCSTSSSTTPTRPAAPSSSPRPPPALPASGSRLRSAARLGEGARHRGHDRRRRCRAARARLREGLEAPARSRCRLLGGPAPHPPRRLAGADTGEPEHGDLLRRRGGARCSHSVRPQRPDPRQPEPPRRGGLRQRPAQHRRLGRDHEDQPHGAVPQLRRPDPRVGAKRRHRADREAAAALLVAQHGRVRASAARVRPHRRHPSGGARERDLRRRHAAHARGVVPPRAGDR